jgi:hypothetical protein
MKDGKGGWVKKVNVNNCKTHLLVRREEGERLTNKRDERNEHTLSFPFLCSSSKGLVITPRTPRVQVGF